MSLKYDILLDRIGRAMNSHRYLNSTANSVENLFGMLFSPKTNRPNNLNDRHVSRQVDNVMAVLKSSERDLKNLDLS